MVSEAGASYASAPAESNHRLAMLRRYAPQHLLAQCKHATFQCLQFERVEVW